MDSISDVVSTPLFQDVQFNVDGSLKETGKQNVRFRNQKVLSFRAVQKKNEDGELIFDVNGKPVFDIDPKTGLPKKEAFEEIKEFVRVETKGDTNIKDDVANDFDRRQHYRQYKYFREGRIPDGQPLENFDFIQPSAVMELHMHGIHVLEQAAEMSDIVCEQLKDQSGFEIRDIARQWLRINSPQSQATRLTAEQSELARLRKENAELKASKPRLVENEYQAIDQPPVDEVETIELPIEEQKIKAPKPRSRKRKV